MLDLRRNTEPLASDISLVQVDDVPYVPALGPGYEHALSIGILKITDTFIGYIQTEPYYFLPYHYSASYDIFDRVWHVECRDVYGEYVSSLSLSFAYVEDAFQYCLQQLMFSESQAEAL